MSATTKSTAMLQAAKSEVVQEITSWQAEFLELRRHLHAVPELGFEEVETARTIARLLRSYGVDEVHEGIGKTGVVGVLRCSNNAGGNRAVGLRADMDALPIKEETGLPYQSRTPGKMHACGHDGHVTMLLAAAKYLSKHRPFDGTVYFYFQPGEEGHAGARAMLNEGLFERFPPDAVYGLHNWPALPPGAVGLNSARMMAGIDTFRVKVTGVGGHGGHPHEAIDPLLATSNTILALQTIVGRNVNPLQSGVISLHWVNAGVPTALSIIPECVEFAGIVKWYDEGVQSILEKRLREVVTHGAATYGCTALIDYSALYPPTINTAVEAHRVMRAASQIVGEENLERSMAPSMGSEDFAFMLQQRPGAYFRLGIGAPNGRFLHSPHYDFNDDVIPVGASVFVGIVVDQLSGEA